MSQPKPINKIGSNLSLSQSDATPRATPVLTKNILGTCHDSEKFDQYFLCPSIIGKLNYLLHSNRPDMHMWCTNVHNSQKIGKHHMARLSRGQGDTQQELKNLAYTSSIETVTSRYGMMLTSVEIVCQRKTRINWIWHALARYLLYNIWDDWLCESHNFIQIYTSSLLKVRKLHSVKRFTRPFLSSSSPKK